LPFVVVIVPSFTENVVLSVPVAPTTRPVMVIVPGTLPTSRTPSGSGMAGPLAELTTCVMYTPLLKVVTVTGTDVAVPVCVTLVPPEPFTVTVAFILIVHDEVFPEVGGPNCTIGFAVVPPEIVAVLALAPGVTVQLYVLVYAIVESFGLADPVNVIGIPADRLAPDVGEVMLTAIGNEHNDDGNPNSCVSIESLKRCQVSLSSAFHLNSVSESV